MKDGPHFAVGDRVWVRTHPIIDRSRRRATKTAWVKASVVKVVPPKVTGELHEQHEYWMYRVKFDGESRFGTYKVSHELDELIKPMGPLDRMAEIQ